MATNNLESTGVVHYGCATVGEACTLGGLQPGSNSNKLIVLDDVLDKHTYNVSLAEETKVEYSSNNQAVAYDDLVAYDGIFQTLTSPSTQKLGVMGLSSSMVASAFSTSGSGSSDNYLTKSGVSITQCSVNKTKTVQSPGVVRIYLTSISGTYLNQSSRLGYEILLQNFITNLADPTSLSIRSMTCGDCITGATSSSTLYNTSVDASAFNITDSTQKRIVVETGSQIICGMIKQNATDSKYSAYSNFDTQTPQTLSLMLLSVNDSTDPEYTDLLLATVDLELSYVGTIDGQQETIKTFLRFEIWHENVVHKVAAPTIEIDKESIPEIKDETEDKTYTIDPSRCILYTTSDGTALSGTIVQAQSFTGQILEHAGYGKLSDGRTVGWFQYKNTPTYVGGGSQDNLFTNNKNKLLTVTLPEGVEEIKSYSFYKCSKLVSFSFPSTLKRIGRYAFYQSGLVEIVLPGEVDLTNYDNDGVQIDSWAFNQCPNLTKITADRITFLSPTYYQFASCYNLTQVNVKSISLSYPSYETAEASEICGADSFSYCTSLTSDLSPIIGSKYYLWVLPRNMFTGCSQIKSIKRAKQTFREITAHDNIAFLTAKARSHYVYKGCSGLTDIYIEFLDSEAYAEIGFASQTFEGCTNVKNIYCNCKHPPFMGTKNIWKNGAIDPRTCKLYVPTGRTAAYALKAQWGDFAMHGNIYELSEEEFQEVYNSL